VVLPLGMDAPLQKASAGEGARPHKV